MKPITGVIMKTTNPASNWQAMETSMIAVEPDGLGIQSTNPQWDRARAILAGIKTTLRMSLAGQVILGGELSALKSELGFNGSGRRKEKAHGGPFNSAPLTWEGWVGSELGIAESTAERFIACFKVVQKRGQALGEDSEVFRLLSAPPSSLDAGDRKILGTVVNELLKEDRQKDLLRELKIVNGPNVLKGGDTSSAKKTQADSGAVTVLASVHFRNLFNDLKKLQREVCRAREDGNFKSYLFVLPLAPADSEDVVGLMDWRCQFEKLKASIEEDLTNLLDAINSAIEPKMKGPAPKRVRKTNKHNRK